MNGKHIDANEAPVGTAKELVNPKRFRFEVNQLVWIKELQSNRKVIGRVWHDDCEPSYNVEGLTVPFWQSQLGDARQTRGWLIESMMSKVTLWLELRPTGIHWTTDSTQGLRFARREDADAFVRFADLDSQPIIVTEHSWL